MHLGDQNFPRSPVSSVMSFPESPVLMFSAGGVPPEGASKFPCKVYEYRAGVWCAPCSVTTNRGCLEEELTACRCTLFGSANAFFLLEPVQLVKILDSCSDDCRSVRVEPPALQANFYLVNHPVLAGLQVEAALHQLTGSGLLQPWAARTSSDRAVFLPPSVLPFGERGRVLGFSFRFEVNIGAVEDRVYPLPPSLVSRLRHGCAPPS